MKNLFDELLRKNRGFKYIISIKITLKKELMTMSLILKHFTLIH